VAFFLAPARSEPAEVAKKLGRDINLEAPLVRICLRAAPPGLSPERLSDWEGAHGTPGSKEIGP
jgi:hypothetical protein